MENAVECAHARPIELSGIPGSDPYLRAVLQSMPDAVIVSDPQGRITMLNAAAEQMFGYAGEQLIGYSIEILVPQRFRSTHAERREDFLVSPHFRTMGEHFDLYAMRADGTEFPVAVSLGYFDGEIGRLAIATVQDLTELRERDRSIADLHECLLKDVAELAALNSELEAFSYSVSHDLRAPLRTIDGFVHLLQLEHGPGLDEAGRNYIMHIRRAAQRMGSLIDDLLNLARISRGELARTRVDLTAQAHEVVSALRASAPGRNLQCDIADGITAHGDAGLLHIVLENLFSNAFKFTAGRSPARIEFGQQQVEGRIRYFIRDNGAGFDMAYAEKLFGPFQRLHDDREFTGNGIGLAIVQRIINKHGGRVWAEAAPDRGASFYFSL
jgi:PAS domain S-box-containing protein